MPTGEKPYRVYRGGRVKGRVPLERPQARPDRDGRAPRQPKIRRPRRRWSWKRRIGLGLLLLLVLIVVWSIAGYLSFRSGVAKANDRMEQTSPGIDRVLTRGGTSLAVRTIEGFTGLDINHVMIVDFRSFKSLIDNIGGIDINVPEPILSNKFDCPYNAAGCARWKGYRFGRGRQHMDGKRALIYSRIRENQLNPSESDITRGERQQQVMRAVLSKLLGFSTFVKLPFDGSGLLEPLTTDLSAWQFVQLGWVMKRAGQKDALHCRLGGTAASIGGASVIVGTEENLSVVQMVTGRSAPQPPPPGSGPFGPGCVVGSQSFH